MSIFAGQAPAQNYLFHSIQAFLSTRYVQKEQTNSEYQLRCCMWDIAVIELLFATGVYISESCSLKPSDIDLESNNIFLSIAFCLVIIRNYP